MENYLEYAVRDGDTLQTIANDVMDDVSRWQEIAFVNQLKYPYISTDETYKLDRKVAKIGSTLIIPVTINEETLLPRSEIQELYRTTLGQDLAVFDKDESKIELTDEGIAMFRDDGEGDLGTVIGENNLKQSLLLRLATPLGSLLGHTGYGSLIHEMIGGRGTNDNLQRLKVEVERTIRSDLRIKDIREIEASMEGDAIFMSIEIEPEDLNVTIDLNLNITGEGEIIWV